MPSSESSPRTSAAHGRVLPRAAFALAILLPFTIFFLGRGDSPLPSRKNITVLVDAPYLAELVNDSTVLDYLMRAGVHGVVLKPATVGSVVEGRDIAMASGAEILRLFRMEGIVNIWMWEQIKDQPIRSEATYVFTNKLNTFENMLATLQQNLGSEKVRSYKDASHDFGGDIPGNFIIEALAPVDELRSITIGLDRTYRERLSATGLLPVIEISSAEDVKTIPAEGVAILAVSQGAADAAYVRLRPSETYLARGVTNPGWPRARITVNAEDADSFSAGSAVIAKSSDILRVVNDFKAAGFTIAAKASTAAIDGTAREPKYRGIITNLSKALLALYGAYFLFWGMCESRLDRRTMIAIAIFLVGSALLAYLRPARFCEIFVLLNPALLAVAVMRRSRETTSESLAWIAGLAVAASTLAADLRVPGLPAPDPWTSLLIASALACVMERTQSANPFIVAGIALAATGMLPRSVLFAGVLLPLAAIPFAANRDGRIRDAVILFASSASLASLSGNVSTPALQVLHALLLFVILFLLPRLSRLAHEPG